MTTPKPIPKPIPKAMLWCKSKVGVKHTPQVLRAGRVLGALGTCGQHGSKWLCVHHIRCEVCKRVLTYEWQMSALDCPDYTDE